MNKFNPSTFYFNKETNRYKNDFQKEIIDKYIYRFSIEENDLISDTLLRQLQVIAFRYGIAALHHFEAHGWVPAIVQVIERDYRGEATKGYLYSPVMSSQDGRPHQLRDDAVDLTTDKTVILQFADYTSMDHGINGETGIDRIESYATTWAAFYSNLDPSAIKSSNIILSALPKDTVDYINKQIELGTGKVIVPAVATKSDNTSSDITATDANKGSGLVDLTNAFASLSALTDTKGIFESVKSTKNIAFASLGIRQEIDYKKERLNVAEVNENTQGYKRHEKAQSAQLDKLMQRFNEINGTNIFIISEVSEPIKSEQPNDNESIEV